MNQAIVMRRETANTLHAYKEITLEEAAEGLLLMADGSWQTLLPGQSVRTPEKARGLLLLRRRAACENVAGVGGVSARDGRSAGGWGEFQCRLLSARRFAAKHKDALLGGTAAEDILTDEVRAAMRAAFEAFLAETDGAAQALQPLLMQRCADLIAQRLFDCGWQLTGFCLKQLRMQKEAI